MAAVDGLTQSHACAALFLFLSGSRGLDRDPCGKRALKHARAAISKAMEEESTGWNPPSWEEKSDTQILD